MRTDPSYHPAFGASPRSVREHDLDYWTALRIMGAEAEAHELLRRAALIMSREHPAIFTHGETAAADALIDALDRQIDQDIYAEACEVAG